MKDLDYQYNGQSTPITEELNATLEQLYNDTFVLRNTPFNLFQETAKTLLYGEMTGLAESYRKVFFEVLMREDSKEFHVQDAFENLVRAVSDILKLKKISMQTNDADDDDDGDVEEEEYIKMTPPQAIQYHKQAIKRHAERLVDLLEEEIKSLQLTEHKRQAAQEVSNFQYEIESALSLLNQFHQLQLE